MLSHIEIINKEGKITKYQNVMDVLDILADTKQIPQRQIHVISIVGIETNDGIIPCSDWYLKTIDDEWYPESEERLKSLSNEYRAMIDNQDINGLMWVNRNYKNDAIQGLAYKLHITREIDIHQFSRLFECNSILQIINNQDMIIQLSQLADHAKISNVL